MEKETSVVYVHHIGFRKIKNGWQININNVHYFDIIKPDWGDLPEMWEGDIDSKKLLITMLNEFLPIEIECHPYLNTPFTAEGISCEITLPISFYEIGDHIKDHNKVEWKIASFPREIQIGDFTYDVKLI